MIRLQYGKPCPIITDSVADISGAQLRQYEGIRIIEVYTVRCSLASQRCQQIIVSGCQKVKFSAVTIAVHRAFFAKVIYPSCLCWKSLRNPDTSNLLGRSLT
jgi:hypothetical protein